MLLLQLSEVSLAELARDLVACHFADEPRLQMRVTGRAAREAGCERGSS